MIHFDFDKDCCGCASCANGCPVGAITMKQNTEGFLIPFVDESVCTQCGKCERICPHINTRSDIENYSIDDFNGKNAYLYYLDDEKRKDSASGGFVYALSKQVQREGGIVCGCVWTDQIEAEHICSSEETELNRMQSSKYVQSSLRQCFSQIKKELKVGRQVLFCGTPCQTAGLNFFLGQKKYDNLITVALICHGVGSPQVWRKYKKALEKKYAGDLVFVNQRDKSCKGYEQSYCKYIFQNDKLQKTVAMPTYLADPYVFLFTDNLFIRNSCTHCQYKADNSCSDIIVGDFYASTAGAGDLGCTSVIAMSEKGDDTINQLLGVLKKSTMQEVARGNSMLWSSVRRNPRNFEFYLRMRYSKDGDMTLFTDFLPFRFKVKKVLNQLGIFKYLKKLKRIINR